MPFSQVAGMSVSGIIFVFLGLFVTIPAVLVTIVMVTTVVTVAQASTAAVDIFIAPLFISLCSGRSPGPWALL